MGSHRNIMLSVVSMCAARSGRLHASCAFVPKMTHQFPLSRSMPSRGGILGASSHSWCPAERPTQTNEHSQRANLADPNVFQLDAGLKNFQDLLEQDLTRIRSLFADQLQQSASHRGSQRKVKISADQQCSRVRALPALCEVSCSCFRVTGIPAQLIETYGGTGRD